MLHRGVLEHSVTSCVTSLVGDVIRQIICDARFLISRKKKEKLLNYQISTPFWLNYLPNESFSRNFLIKKRSWQCLLQDFQSFTRFNRVLSPFFQGNYLHQFHVISYQTRIWQCRRRLDFIVMTEFLSQSSALLSIWQSFGASFHEIFV